jgi:uncharacterized membrane protein
MLGIFFIYFIGKFFYDLAVQYKHNKWLFAVLGIASYYIGGFTLLAGFAIVAELIATGFMESFSETQLSFLIIPMGILACAGFYQLLKYRWKNEVQPVIENIDDIGRE